jgi:hypothetical protein
VTVTGAHVASAAGATQLRLIADAGATSVQVTVAAG